MLVINLIEDVLPAMVTAGLMFWRDRKSKIESMKQLRAHFTINQLASFYKIHPVNVARMLGEVQSYADIQSVVYDSNEHWRVQYREWCQMNNAHYEIGPCSFCAECKKKKEAADQELAKTLHTGHFCIQCGRTDCNLDCTSSSSYGSFLDDDGISDHW